MSYIYHTEVFSLRFPAIYKNQNCLWLPYRRYLLVLLVVTPHNDSIMGKSSRFRKLALAFIFAQGKRNRNKQKILLSWVGIFISYGFLFGLSPSKGLLALPRYTFEFHESRLKPQNAWNFDPFLLSFFIRLMHWHIWRMKRLYGKHEHWWA